MSILPQFTHNKKEALQKAASPYQVLQLSTPEDDSRLVESIFCVQYVLNRDWFMTN